MGIKILRIATRKSPLALWQAQHVADMLKHHWPKLGIELLPMTTSGDRFLKDKLLSVGGKGLFVKELEDALLNHKADLAVHSMKDVPSAFPEGLILSTICIRENPYDALVSRHHSSLNTLPNGAVIGTSSLRRQSQLLALRPDLNIVALRGNIHTRIDKLDTEKFDAIILAAAGLIRMGMQEHIKQIIPSEIMLPACGQGALGIECRANDEALHELIKPLNDSITAHCVTTERRVNSLLGGNCHVPLAVYCQPIDSTQIRLRAKVASANGQTVITNSTIGSIEQAQQLASNCADALLAKGAIELLQINPL
ncbi:MAG: hydroxymethylbilane synthase [Legionellaceae bacterium]|nr:hydroxymethylbilane synthase [Legionellaceae bacterium]